MINDSFGSFEKMKEDFPKSMTTRFGSGWAALFDGKGHICSTPNQDNADEGSVEENQYWDLMSGNMHII